MNDSAPLGVVDEEPAVLLLALPVMQADPLLFDSPPDPALLLVKDLSPKESPPVTSNLIDFLRVSETVALSLGGLPEPFLPEPEVAVEEEVTGEEVVAEEEVTAEEVVEGGGSGEPGVRRPVTTQMEEMTQIGATAAPVESFAEPAAAQPSAPEVAAPEAERVVAGTFLAPEVAQPVNTSAVHLPGAKGQSDRRALTFQLGETISLALEGRGWIFTGSTGGGEIVLLSRTINAVETRFRFDGASAGHYVLGFQIQDNQSGTLMHEGVTVIVQEARAEASPEWPVEAPAGPQMDATASAKASSPASLPSNLAQALEDPETAVAALNELLSSATADQQEELRRITEWYKAAGYVSEYAMCLERYLQVFPHRWDNDFRYYELGRLYETDLLRNEKKARQYYATVVDLYPASLYYLDAARRVRYLDRHFFNLR